MNVAAVLCRLKVVTRTLTASNSQDHYLGSPR